MFVELERINKRPEPFSAYTVEMLWNDPYVSGQMLKAHLNPANDAASYRAELRDEAIEWLAESFELGSGKRVCDFGCGPGLYTTRFAEMGADVVGVDLSQRSIEYARNTAIDRGLKIEYLQQNYLEFASARRFDLITMISRDFAVLSPTQRRKMLAVFRDHLSDDGAIVLDVDSWHRFSEFKEAVVYRSSAEGGFWSPEAHHSFMHSFKYKAEKVLLEKHVVVEAEQTREIYNWYQCYSPESLTALFAAAELVITEWYGDVAGRPFAESGAAYAIVARKAT